MAGQTTLHAKESDIPAPVLTGILAAGYGGVLVACMILERLGVPGGIIQWFAIGGAMIPFLALGLLSGTMNAVSFANGTQQGGSLFQASAMAGATLTGGLLFAASWLAVSDVLTGLVLACGLAAGIGLHALAGLPGAGKAPEGSAAWQLSYLTASRRVRWLAAAFLILTAGSLLLAQFQALRILLDMFFPAAAPVSWPVLAALALAGAWTGGFKSASRSTAFSLAIVATGIAAPIAVLLRAAGDLTWGELFGGATEIGLMPADPADMPLVLSAWEWGVTPVTGWSGGLALFVCMVLAGFLFAALLPAARDARRGRPRPQVPLLAALLLLVVAVATGMNARLAGMIASGSLADVTAGQVATDAGWLFRDGVTGVSGLVEICGMPATSPAIVQAACGTAGHLLTADDIRLNPVSAFLLPAAAFGMPAAVWPAVLLAVTLAAAGTATAMLAAIGRLLAEGAAVNRSGRAPRPASRRLAVARAGMLAIAIAAAWLTQAETWQPFDLALWPASLATAALAVPLALSRWHGLMRASLVSTGMLAGASVPAAVLLAGFMTGGADLAPTGTGFAESIARTPIPVAVLYGAGLNLVILMLGWLPGQERHKDAGRTRDHEQGLSGSPGA